MMLREGRVSFYGYDEELFKSGRSLHPRLSARIENQ
jgi:hypothetical protein